MSRYEAPNRPHMILLSYITARAVATDDGADVTKDEPFSLAHHRHGLGSVGRAASEYRLRQLIYLLFAALGSAKCGHTRGRRVAGFKVLATDEN